MITGSMVALVTPMTPSGDIDWPGLKTLVDFHLQEGTHAIVAVGYDDNQVIEKLSFGGGKTVIFQNGDEHINDFAVAEGGRLTLALENYTEPVIMR